MSVFFQAGAVLGLFDVVAARAFAPLALEDAIALFLFPIGLFAVAGAVLSLGGLATSRLRRKRGAADAPAPLALAACLLPILIEGLRGCLRECGFTPGQWALRFLPTLLLLLGLAGSRRFLKDPPVPSTSLVVFLAGALSVLLFETRFDVAGRAPFRFVPVYLGWAALSMLVFFLINLRTVRGGASILALAVVAAGAALTSGTPAAQIRRPTVAVETAPVSAGSAPPFNILLVVLDGVRADRMPPFENRQARTPSFDALAGSSYVFTRAIASSDYSLPSHASLLTGTLPSEHGAHPIFALAGSKRIHSPVTGAGPTVAQRLRAAGFETLGLSANYVFLRPWTGLLRGFDQFDDRPRRFFRSSPLAPTALGLLADWVGPPFRPLLPYRTAGEIRLQFQEELSQARAPFFAFLNLMDAHEPRVPRTPRNPWSPRAARIRSYDDAVEFMDGEVGALLRWMDERGLLETTCVVLTSDHGEFLGEGGLWGHGFGVSQTLLHVPLQIRPPRGLRNSTVVHEPLGLHEVMSLVLSWGSEIRPPETGGREPRILAEAWSFPGGGHTEGLPDERAVFLGDLKLVAGRHGERKLFDLRRDPTESRDLWSTLDPEQRARFEVEARRPVASRRGPSTAPDAEAIERMRSLGYVGPGPRR